MHDQIILKQLLEPLQKLSGVKKAVVELGEIASLESNHLQESWRNMSDIPLEIVSKSALAECFCGFKGAPEIVERLHDGVVIECAECGETPTVLEGDQIVLREVQKE